MRAILVVILCFYCFQPLFSQTWDSLGSGTDSYVRVLYTDSANNVLYAGGGFKTIDGINVRGIAKWDGIKWDSLSSGIDNHQVSFPSPVLSIFKYKNEIYIGGNFDKVGNVWAKNIAKWNGFQWDSLPNNTDGIVYNMTEHNNLLYVVGLFDTVGTIYSPDIAIWDGVQWLPFPISPPFSNISSLVFYNDNLYVGGTFDTINGFNSIAKWDGIQWLPIENGFVGSMSWVNCFEVYKNELYIGGLFFNSDGNKDNHIARWNDTLLSSLGGGAGGNPFPQVLDLTVYKNELYAVGVFNTMGGIPADRIAKWDGTQWCGLGSVFDNNIQVVVSYKDSLTIGGGFSLINNDSINDVAYWISGNFIDTCISVVGIENIEVQNRMSIYPNPNNGIFTIEKSNLGSTTIEIYNLSGQLILHELFVEHITQVNLTNYPKGLYLVKIISDNKVTVKKIVYQ